MCQAKYLWETTEKAVNHILDIIATMGFEEVAFHCNGGLLIKEMDPSRVCAVIASIALGQQELTEQATKRSFTVSLNALRQALKLKDPLFKLRLAE